MREPEERSEDDRAELDRDDVARSEEDRSDDECEEDEDDEDADEWEEPPETLLMGCTFSSARAEPAARPTTTARTTRALIMSSVSDHARDRA